MLAKRRKSLGKEGEERKRKRIAIEGGGKEQKEIGIKVLRGQEEKKCEGV